MHTISVEITDSPFTTQLHRIVHLGRGRVERRSDLYLALFVIPRNVGHIGYWYCFASHLHGMVSFREKY